MNLAKCSWDVAEGIVRESGAVMVLIGSTEEHGRHLPIDTDTVITELIARRLCKDKGLCYYPCIAYGQVWSAKGFPGTISIPPEILKRYLKEVIRCVNRQGAKRVILYSFHNGNAGVIKECIRELEDENGFCNVFMLETTGIHKLAADVLTTPVWNDTLWHAGELETSLMLYLKEEDVRMEKAGREFPVVPLGYGERPTPWNTFSDSGAFGDSGAATKEKGERIFEIIIQYLEERVTEIEKVICD